MGGDTHPVCARYKSSVLPIRPLLLLHHLLPSALSIFSLQFNLTQTLMKPLCRRLFFLLSTCLSPAPTHTHILCLTSPFPSGLHPSAFNFPLFSPFSASLRGGGGHDGGWGEELLLLMARFQCFYSRAHIDRRVKMTCIYKKTPQNLSAEPVKPRAKLDHVETTSGPCKYD